MTSAPRDSVSRSPEHATLDLQDTTKVLIPKKHESIEQQSDCQLLSPKRAKKLAKYIKDSMESHSHPPEKPSRPEVEFKSYERMLLLLTQVGYLPVAASMLSTTFFEPSKHFCHHIRNRTYDSTALQFKALEIGEFYSLLFEWQEICIQSSWMVRISMAVMFGAVFGAFLAGFMADFFGRKPVVVFSLFFLTLANLTLVFFGSFSPIISTSVFFLMGCASGGYMVTNVVFIIEAVKTERERLVVASLNGWPIGMVFTAVISYISGEQKSYYLIVAGTSLAIAGLLQFSSFESVGWLANQNEEVKAACVRRQIKLRNNPGSWHNWSLRSLGSRKTCSRLQRLRKAESVPGLCSKCQYCDNNVDENKEIADEKVAVTFTAAGNVDAEDQQISAADTATAQTIFAEDETTNKPKKQSTMTYLDLFKHSTIRRPLFALLYCFLSSSVVSFGFYFNADYLPGNRYANLGLMGLLKFILGLIPFAFSYIIPKKVIILLSVGTACICCWILIAVTSMVHLGDSIVITALGLMVTASMDPTWKIIHLYSVELFPTAVRNMARGACNVTARLGSMSGPLIILLRTMNPTLPYWLFAGLLSLQWMVLACLMPNQSVDSLPEGMPMRKRNSVLSKA